MSLSQPASQSQSQPAAATSSQSQPRIQPLLEAGSHLSSVPVDCYVEKPSGI